MAKTDTITKEVADQFLNYNSETGVFTWKPKGETKNSYHGREAGTLDRGYVCIFVKGVKVPAHRLAWLMTHGSLPSKDFVIDHINHDRSDNRIENLRVISYKHNSVNSVKARTTSKTGVIGVSYLWGKYRARITGHNGEFVYLGSHATLEEAAYAYQQAKQAMYPGVLVSTD